MVNYWTSDTFYSNAYNALQLHECIKYVGARRNHFTITYINGRKLYISMFTTGNRIYVYHNTANVQHKMARKYRGKADYIIEKNKNGIQELLDIVFELADESTQEYLSVDYANQEPPELRKFIDGYPVDEDDDLLHGNINMIHEVSPVAVCNSLIKRVEQNFSVLEHENEIAFLIDFSNNFGHSTGHIIAKDGGFWVIEDYKNNDFVISNEATVLYESDKKLIDHAIKRYVNRKLGTYKGDKHGI